MGVTLASSVPVYGHRLSIRGGVYSLPFYPASAFAGEYYSSNPNGDQFNVYDLVSYSPGTSKNAGSPVTVNIYPFTVGPITVTGCWVYTLSSVMTNPQHLVYPVGAPAVNSPNMVGCADVGVIY